MKSFLLITILLGTASYAQDTQYRMQMSIGVQSNVNWGIKEFEGLTNSADFLSFYVNEKYDVKYKKNNLSPGIVLGFAVNLLLKEKFILRQNFNLTANSYSEQITFKIADIGNGDTTGLFIGQSKKKLPLGYQGNVISIGNTYRAKTELLFLYRYQNTNFGLGFSYAYQLIEDDFRYSSGYNPWSWGRQKMGYTTNKLGISAHFEYVFGRLTTFFNFSQEILTLKKEKGGIYFDEEYEIYPFSHNLDFRFPSTFTVGLSFNFKEVNSRFNAEKSTW